MSEERAASALDKRIGLRVRARRLGVNMSQEQLANLVGVTFQQVQKYERGVNRIAASRLAEIAVALGAPVVTFFDTESDGSAAGGGLEQALATPGAADLLHLYATIESPALRRRLIGLVRALVDET